MTGNVNPGGGTAPLHLSADPAVIEAAREEYRGMGPAALDETRTGIEGTLQNVFDAAGDNLDLRLVKDLDGFGGSLKEKAAKVVELNSRMTAIQEVLDERAHLARIRDAITDRNNGGGGGGEDPDAAAGDGAGSQPSAADRGRVRAAPRLSDLLFASARNSGINLGDLGLAEGQARAFELDMDPSDYLSAVVTTTAGMPPDVTRQPGVTAAISRPIQVIDVLPQSTTDQTSIKYLVQNLRTAGLVVEKAEGAEAGEAAMSWEERDEPIRRVPAFIPITEEQLEDEAQARVLVDDDLRLMVMQRTDGQVVGLAANGTLVAAPAAPNIAGLGATRSGVGPLTREWTGAGGGGARTAVIADLRRARTQCRREGRCSPNVYLLNDAIWDEVVLSDTSGSGYYLGSPATDFVERLWGLPVVPTDHLSDALTANAVGGMVMDTMYSRLWWRRVIHTEIGLSGTDFIKHQLTIRAAVRVAVQVRRPQSVLVLDMPA